MLLRNFCFYKILSKLCNVQSIVITALNTLLPSLLTGNDASPVGTVLQYMGDEDR